MTMAGQEGRGFFAHVAGEFTTRAWVLIPIGIAINVVGGVLVNVLRLPVFLDVIGTIMVAVLAGPWVGALTGTLTNVILGVVARPTLIPYAIVNAAIGLVAGYLALGGWFKRIWKVAVVGIALVFTAVLTASPITVWLFGGVTGSGADLVRGALLAAGQEIIQSVVTTAFIVEPIDKIASAFIAFFLARAIPLRYRPILARQTLP
ncbi:MAG: ECF transporter S component [Actinomycetota bacterium]|nr:ECF transporter S component [Actinomycetota bacterium]